MTTDGSIYEGRLRWGGDEEAFWGDYFNGSKAGNLWAAQVPSEQLIWREPVVLFGAAIFQRTGSIDLDRPFMARFGDIARIEAGERDIQVTLKSGTVIGLDRYDADDLADGLRVWDTSRGVVDLDEWAIRRVEFLPAPEQGAVPERLHGTVQTAEGDFTGFVQWDQREGVGTGELDGFSSDAERHVRFDSIAAIARDSRDSSVVTLLDGSEVVLSGREVGEGNRGIYVDDRRYGRVLIFWRTFERVDFSPGASGPAFDDFPPGQPLAGRVTTRDGRRLEGRLVYDLDESETVETLDARSRGVNYNIPFGLIASILLPGPDETRAGRANVVLHSGETLELEMTGDLAAGTAGMSIFGVGSAGPEYVPWIDVASIEFDRPTMMYPSMSSLSGGR